MTTNQAHSSFGDADEEFAALYWDGLEESADISVLDPDLRERIPVNPLPDQLINSFAVKFPSHVVPPDSIRTPNMAMSDANHHYYLWFFHPVDPNAISEKTQKTSQLYLFMMVQQVYSSVLEGEELDTYPNPLFHFGSGTWNSRTSTLGSMKTALQDDGLWRDTLPKAFLRRGGESRSEAKVRAARENLQLATKAKVRASDARARWIVESVDGGATLDDLAERLGVAVDNMPRIVARARHRLAIPNANEG